MPGFNFSYTRISILSSPCLPFQPLSFEDAASGNAIYTPALADNCTFVIEAGEAGSSEVTGSDDHILIFFYNSSCEVAQEPLPKAYASTLTDDKVIALVVTWGLGSLVVVLLWGRREYGSAPEQQDIRRLNTINRLGLSPKGPCPTVCTLYSTHATERKIHTLVCRSSTRLDVLSSALGVCVCVRCLGSVLSRPGACILLCVPMRC